MAQADRAESDNSGHDDLLRENRDLLSPRQLAALEVRLVGGSQSDAAQRAGVDERTIRRWESHNYAYEAEWNRRLVKRNYESAEKIREIWDLATDNMIALLREGDRSATSLVFKSLVNQPPKYPVGPSNTHEVRRERVQALLWRIQQDRFDMLEASSLPSELADVASDISDERDRLANDL